MRPAVIARLLASSAVLLAAASSPAADDLPPPDAPGYSAVYQRTSRFRETSLDEWTEVPRETVTIAVLGTKSRWDQGDGRVHVNDTVDRSTVSFGGNIPARTAHRRVVPRGVDWEFGYGKAAKESPPPERLGTDTIAGRECTRLKFTSELYGTPEYCVTGTGIVLRFRNATPTAETTLEAMSVTAEPPASDRFAPPAGYVVEERHGPRTLPPILPPPGAM